MALFERDYVEGNNKKSPGSGLFSHAVASAVSSVLKRFTTVFGKGTGGSVSLVPPRSNIILIVKRLGHKSRS